MGRLHPGRQALRKRVIVQIDVHVGQDGAPGLHPGDPFEGPVHVGVGGMRRIAQRIDDPDVQIRESLEGLLRQGDHIAGIGHVSKAIAQGTDPAMVLVKGGDRNRAGRAVHGPGLAVLRRRPGRGDGGIAPLPVEDIAEPALKAGAGHSVHPAVDPVALNDGERADVVDAMALVGVVVGDQQGVQPPQICGDRLQAQFRRGVDQNAGLAFGSVAGSPAHHQRAA